MLSRHRFLNQSPAINRASVGWFIRAALGSARLILLATLAFASRRVAADTSDPRPLSIEGYAGKVSYKAGDELSLHVSTTAPTFTVEIARLGAQRDVVYTNAEVAGREAPIPEDASAHGCGWPALLTLPVPAEWRSGYYEVSLSAQDRGGTYVNRGRRTAEATCFSIVRAATPGARSRTLLQLSTNTSNAYNNWGGFSLYAYNGLAGVQGHRVSFHRPPARTVPAALARLLRRGGGTRADEGQ